MDCAARARRCHGRPWPMLQSVFVTAHDDGLSALAVVALGGSYALKGSLEPGARRRRAAHCPDQAVRPTGRGARCRRKLRAGLRRVLDLALIHGVCRTAPSFSHVTLTYPARRQGLPRLARGGRDARQPQQFPARRSGSRSRADGGTRPHVGRREVNDRQPDPAPLRRRQRLGCVWAGSTVRDLSMASLRATLGMATQDGHLFHRSVRANLLLARPDRRRAVAALRNTLSTTSWLRCRTVSTRSSVSVATGSPAGSAPATHDRSLLAHPARRDPRRGDRPRLNVSIGGRAQAVRPS